MSEVPLQRTHLAVPRLPTPLQGAFLLGVKGLHPFL